MSDCFSYMFIVSKKGCAAFHILLINKISATPT